MKWFNFKKVIKREEVIGGYGILCSEAFHSLYSLSDTDIMIKLRGKIMGGAFSMFECDDKCIQDLNWTT
jgi:hypothetical protein